MFEFSNQFDIIENSQLKLLIIQKHPGDSELIPFYYYDIERTTRDVCICTLDSRCRTLYLADIDSIWVALFDCYIQLVYLQLYC